MKNLFLVLFLFCIHNFTYANSAVEAYLANLYTLQADFTQFQAGEPPAKGRFFFSNEGRMRWDYITPRAVTLIAKGKVATFYDEELQEDSSVFIDDTLNDLLKNPHFLTLYFNVNERKNDFIFTQIRDNADLSVVFNKNPIFLKKVLVNNGISTIEINFFNLKENLPLPPQVFKHKSFKN